MCDHESNARRENNLGYPVSSVRFFFLTFRLRFQVEKYYSNLVESVARVIKC